MARAAIYCRISRDPEGLRLGVERQQEDCDALARRQGHNVVATYIDNDISASTLSSKPRPQYAAMLDAARAGEFDVLVAYSNSRLTRRLRELEDLIQLHEQHGIRIVTIASGEDNLSTADGRMVARIKASVDAAEAERTAERLRRAFLQRAQRGTTNHSGRTFGWGADRIALDEAEAGMIRDAARDVLDGVPLRELARQWNAQGIPTSRGNAWTHTTLRRLLKRPRLCGYQVHQGQILLDASGSPVQGEWVPIFTPDEFERLQVALARDTTGGARRGARRYLLTGLVRCSTCGERMNGSKTRTGYAYTCSREPFTHSVTIEGSRTDDLVLALVKARLAREDLDADPADEPGTTDTPGISSEDRLAQIPQLIGELMDAFRAGKLSGALVFSQIEQLEAERAELTSAHAARIAASAVPAHVDADDLDDLDVDRQRAILETVLDAVVVAPAGRRGEPWTPERITPAWR